MIACYASTEDAEEEIKDEFYEQLEEEIRTTPQHMYSMQELERTMQEEKGSWAPKALGASITTVRDFLTYMWKIT